jgi:hypothetical protein
MEDLELKPKQLITIASLARGSTINQAASDAGVSEKTVDVWLKKPTFKAELRRVITVEYKHHLTKLQGLLGKGIERLEDILDNETSQPSDIIRTVHLLLSACDRYQESSLVDRIEDLEREVNES